MLWLKHPLRMRFLLDFIVLAILATAGSRSVVIAVRTSKRLLYAAGRLDPQIVRERFKSSRHDNDDDDNGAKHSIVTDNTCITTRGGDNAELRCPEKTVISGIAFASFGTPGGTCGNYHLSACHASTSEHVLKNLCLSRSICKIRAVPETFGAVDACIAVPTTEQELVIEYSCDVRGKIRPTSKPIPNTTTSVPPKVNTSKLQVAPRASVTIGSGLVVDGSTTLYHCQWEGYPDHLERYLTDSDKYDVDQLYYGRSRTHHYFQHIFSEEECGGALPSGVCFASFRRMQHCGPDRAWSILHPQDEDGPAVLWFNDAPCIPNEARDPPARLAVDFLCPSHLEAPHLHQCMFEGSAADLNSSMVDPNNPSAGNYFAKRFDASECTNGLPPLKEGKGASCLSSITWMEHCGDEHDWSFNPADDLSTFLDEKTGAPVLRWYTAHECDMVRVGMDFFCPMDVFDGGTLVASSKKDKAKPASNAKSFSLPHLHRCSATISSLDLHAPSSDNSLLADLALCVRVHSMAYYDGYNALGAATSEDSLPKIIGEQPLGCRYLTFSDKDCVNGLPPANASCAVSLHAMGECGREQDWDADTLDGSATAMASVRWYNGLGRPCGKATVAVDYYCPLAGQKKMS